MTERVLEKKIRKKLFTGKAIILFGARQVGKTVLLKQLFKNRRDVIWFDGDTVETKTVFENLTVAAARQIIQNARIVVIDEAQSIADIGTKLKIFTDHIPEVQLIATGSSSFDLANKINEPLTGRKWEFMLFPFSFSEMTAHTTVFEERNKLEQRLIFGYYPDIVNHPESAVELLQNLSSSYLYKDVLQWEALRKSDKLVKLLQALAFQTGSQISYTELGTICGLDSKTAEKYIGLLEQTFVIFKLPSFSKNLRNELKFSKKMYFYDNGIRNSVIANYNPPALRNDVGSLWENFLISERMKKNAYEGRYVNRYFWRTTAQKEIDYIEEINGKIFAYEFKWSERKSAKIPADFVRAYPDAAYQIITPSNFMDFITTTDNL